MAQLDAFLGTDTQGNPITDSYYFHGDARYTARSEDAARQFDWNMMNYLNWWNSPEQLLSRMKDAGLNPLFYLGGNAGTTPAAAGGNLQGHQMTSASGKLGQVLEASKAAADTLLGTQKQALDYEIARREQNLEMKRINLEDRQVQVQEEELGLKKTRQPYELQNLEASTNELYSRSHFNEAQIDRIAKENEWTDQQIANAKVEIAKMNKEIEEIGARMAVYASEVKKNEAQALESIAQANFIDDTRWPTVEKLSAETDMTTELAREAIAKTANFVMDTEKKEVEIDIGKGQALVLQRTAEGIEIKNALDKRYGDAERIIDLGGKIVHSASEAVNTAINVKTGGAAAALSQSKKAVLDSNTAQNAENERYRELSTKIEQLNDEILDVNGDPTLDPKMKKSRLKALNKQRHEYEQELSQMKHEDYKNRGFNSKTNHNPTFTFDY